MPTGGATIINISGDGELDDKQTFAYLGGFAKSQSGETLFLEGDQFDFVPMESPGSILKVIILSSDPRTAGECSAKITKNGSPIAQTDLDVKLDATNPQEHKKEIAKGTVTFASGDKIGVELSSDSNLEPNDSDIRVIIHYILDD